MDSHWTFTYTGAVSTVVLDARPPHAGQSAVVIVGGYAIGANGAHRVTTSLSTKLFRKGVGRNGQGERGDNEDSLEELHFG